MSTENETTQPVTTDVEITLSDGRKALIKKGKGRDSVEALKRAGTESESYLSHLMSLLVTINGAPVVGEDLLDMNLKDYQAIQTKFSEVNF